ncbi:hypothetical protein JCM3775_006861 [Rhodotorula graminis]|uniref:Uncharacterized protein n=1 Tax=Rhodotorula graminis (strain WP1) TaxID=578459 RepID=A0A194SAQ3_RHOGW|nr:uncharacterized protein RHOBADRAFT_41801 [Rhodotorula graminis WP1]KPV77803.1 hypothetical protein RHOBADRAFT_41801 [Rhodotorula graminis WP1]
MCRPGLDTKDDPFDPQARTPPPRPRRPTLELSPDTRHIIDRATGWPPRSPSAPSLGPHRPHPVVNHAALAALTRSHDEVRGNSGVLDPEVAHLFGTDAWLHIGNTDRNRRLMREQRRAAKRAAQGLTTPSPVFSVRSASAPASPGPGESHAPIRSWFSVASSSSGDHDDHDDEPPLPRPLPRPRPGLSVHRGRQPGLVLSRVDGPPGAVRHLALPAIGSPFNVRLPALARGRTPSPELRQLSPTRPRRQGVQLGDFST